MPAQPQRLPISLITELLNGIRGGEFFIPQTSPFVKTKNCLKELLI
jgi:hypothetical protein